MTICQDTVRQSILVVAVYDTIYLAIVIAIQTAIFLNAIVIDISCQVTVRVGCQVTATARLAVVVTNPEAWMMQLAVLFPLPPWKMYMHAQQFNSEATLLQYVILQQVERQNIDRTKSFKNCLKVHVWLELFARF